MQFEWDTGHDAPYDAFQRLGEDLGKDIHERDRTGTFARGDWETCAAQGVQGLLLPAEYGGGGSDPVGYARAMEALGRGCADNGLLFSLGAHVLAVQMPIWKFGNAAQRVRYLPGLAAGQVIGGHAITEPGTGSDALAVAATAERDGDGYRLTGRKCYVTNAPVADVFIVHATVNPELGFTGVTAFLVERDDPGVTVTEGPDKLGLRTAPWGDIELRECRVPADRRLGAEKQGSAIFAHTMLWERSLILAPWLGVLDREVAECVGFARRRRQFGQHIGRFQAVSNRLVDMWLRAQTARLWIHRAAAALHAGQSGNYAEACKLMVSEAAVETFTAAMQIYGALGYTTDGRAERNLRDALGLTVASGTSDLQRVVIAGRLGIPVPERQ